MRRRSTTVLLAVAWSMPASAARIPVAAGDRQQPREVKSARIWEGQNAEFEAYHPRRADRPLRRGADRRHAPEARVSSSRRSGRERRVEDSATRTTVRLLGELQVGDCRVRARQAAGHGDGPGLGREEMESRDGRRHSVAVTDPLLEGNGTQTQAGQVGPSGRTDEDVRQFHLQQGPQRRESARRRRLESVFDRSFARLHLPTRTWRSRWSMSIASSGTRIQALDEAQLTAALGKWVDKAHPRDADAPRPDEEGNRQTGRGQRRSHGLPSVAGEVMSAVPSRSPPVRGARPPS